MGMIQKPGNTVKKNDQGFTVQAILGFVTLWIGAIGCAQHTPNRFELLEHEQRFRVGDVADNVVQGQVPEVHLYFLDLSGSMGPHLERLFDEMRGNILARYGRYEEDTENNLPPNLKFIFISSFYMFFDSVYQNRYICGSIQNCGYPSGKVPGEVLSLNELQAVQATVGSSLPKMSHLVSTQDSQGNLRPRSEIERDLQSLRTFFIQAESGTGRGWESTIMAAKTFFDLNRDWLRQVIPENSLTAWIFVTDEEDQAEEKKNPMPSTNNHADRFTRAASATQKAKTFSIANSSAEQINLNGTGQSSLEFSWNIASGPNWIVDGQPLDPNNASFVPMNTVAFAEELKQFAASERTQLAMVNASIQELRTLLLARAGLDLRNNTLPISDLLNYTPRDLFYDLCQRCDDFIQQFSSQFSSSWDLGVENVFAEALGVIEEAAQWAANRLEVKHLIDTEKPVSVSILNENGQVIRALIPEEEFRVSDRTIFLNSERVQLTNPDYSFQIRYTPKNLVVNATPTSTSPNQGF